MRVYFQVAWRNYENAETLWLHSFKAFKKISEKRLLIVLISSISVAEREPYNGELPLGILPLNEDIAWISAGSFWTYILAFFNSPFQPSCHSFSLHYCHYFFLLLLVIVLKTESLRICDSSFELFLHFFPMLNQELFRLTFCEDWIDATVYLCDATRNNKRIKG